MNESQRAASRVAKSRGENRRARLSEAGEVEAPAWKKVAAKAKRKPGAQNNDYTQSNAIGATFWMSLDDFLRHFYIMTLAFAKKEYVHSFVSDQAFSFRWCCAELNLKTTERDCFFSVYQMNDRFMDDLHGGDENYEYANMQLIVTKVIKVPPKTGRNTSEHTVTGECAYVDGICDDLYNTASLKIDKMTAGKYLIFYTANFSAS